MRENRNKIQSLRKGKGSKNISLEKTAGYYSFTSLRYFAASSGGVGLI
jgi:hypothetical protein